MEPFESKENIDILTPSKAKLEKIYSNKQSDITRIL
jgi:hypothetical protein